MEADAAESKFCVCGGLKMLRRIQQGNDRIGIGYVDVYVCDECHRLHEFVNPARKRVVAKEGGDEW